MLPSPPNTEFRRIVVLFEKRMSRVQGKSSIGIGQVSEILANANCFKGPHNWSKPILGKDRPFLRSTRKLSVVACRSVKRMKLRASPWQGRNYGHQHTQFHFVSGVSTKTAHSTMPGDQRASTYRSRTTTPRNIRG